MDPQQPQPISQAAVPQATGSVTPPVATPLLPQTDGVIWLKRAGIAVGVLLGVSFIVSLALFLPSAIQGAKEGWQEGLQEGKDTKQSNVSTNKINSSIKTNMKTKEITFKQFFPLLSGNMADYPVIVPDDYVTSVVSINNLKISATSPLINNSLTGKEDDVIDILFQAGENGKISFSALSSGLFRARFTATTGLSDQGQFIDQTNGPVTEEMYTATGMTNVVFKPGYFKGIQAAPTLMVTAEYQGSHVRMFYVYSPVDNLTVLISLQGGADQEENTAIWDAFVGSTK